jgi:hypothetical protein
MKVKSCPEIPSVWPNVFVPDEGQVWSGNSLSMGNAQSDSRDYALFEKHCLLNVVIPKQS